MLFNSYIFIFAFLPICILGYFGLNHFEKYTWAKLFLFVMSCWFYAYNNVAYLAILLFSVLINYGVYLWMQRARARKKSLKGIMLFGVVINVGVLLYFKYMDFFIDNVNFIFGADLPFLRIALPLGISFFTFQQISFVVDCYRGEIDQYSFWDYACFVTYFPQLIAGPIVTHTELVPQFSDVSKKKFDYDNMLKGIYIFSMGLAKKVLIADTFGKMVSYGYATVDSLGTITAIITILSYTIQIYFDFSGYCDMAIGIGKMMNIDLPVNFNSPYKACTITEFWDSWHMTLTRFFTRYVYIPLGGSRKGKYRTYLNVFLVFLISGFWHGASWSFVLWGVMHGVLNILTRMAKGLVDRIPRAINWCVTFVFVNVAWVFFRAESIPQACTVLKKVFVAGKPMDWGFYRALSAVEIEELQKIVSIDNVFMPMILVALFVFALTILLTSKNAYERMQAFRPSILKLGGAMILLFWSILSFAGISTFLYFNF